MIFAENWSRRLAHYKEKLETVNRCAVDKDKLLGSLDQKLKELEKLFLQKEKDVLETHQAKEEPGEEDC